MNTFLSILVGVAVGVGYLFFSGIETGSEIINTQTERQISAFVATCQIKQAAAGIVEDPGYCRKEAIARLK